jgi:hypothetical protein
MPEMPFDDPAWNWAYNFMDDLGLFHDADIAEVAKWFDAALNGNPMPFDPPRT